MTPLKINTIVNNRYKITDHLAISPNKIVYLTKDLKINCLMVLKQYSTQPPHLNQVIQWSFYNIPRITDSYHAKDFFVIENYVFGESLDAIQKINGSDLQRYLVNIAEALLYIHQFNLNHGDIKPGNIIIGHDNIAYLIDFDTLNTNDDAKIYGITPEYTAPEVLLAEENLNIQTDIYSYGKTFLALYRKHRLNNKKILSILRKTCQFDSFDRFNDCLEILNCLNRL